MRRLMRLSSFQVPSSCQLLATLAVATSVVAPLGFAGESKTESLAEREVTRRQGLLQQAADLLSQGQKADQASDWVASVAAYRQAYQLLPKAPFTEGLRAQAREGLCQASVALAGQQAEAGSYDEANRTLDAVLDVAVAPDCAPAIRLKQRVQDPQVYNPAMTPQHRADVLEVTRQLQLANGAFALGKFDDSRKAFNAVLAIDHYNTAARRGLEKLEKEISKYYGASRDHVRANLIREVDAQWEVQVPHFNTEGVSAGPDHGGDVGRGLTTRDKINAIILPQVDFLESSIDEAVEYLRIQAKTFDTVESDPTRKGINIVVGNTAGLAQKKFSLSLSNVPISEVIRQMAVIAGVPWRVDDQMVMFGGTGTALVSRTFTVPPDFIRSNVDLSGASAGGGTDPFAATGNAAAAPALKIVRVSAMDFLKQNGIQFADDTSATFNTASSTLVVRNTQANLDLVQALVDTAYGQAPRMVKLQLTMIDSRQEDLEEIGYDWLIGQSNVPGTGRAFLSGGTQGNMPGSAASAALNAPEALGVQAGGGTLTAGNRSGSMVSNPNTIESLLVGDRHAQTIPGIKAPGVFGVSGVFTDPQFQMVLRGLNQKKGVDFMTAPSITMKSGQRSSVKMTREFPYPTEFEPPEIPQDLGSNVTQSGVIVTSTSITVYSGYSPPQDFSMGFPVTPTTPTAFEKKELGISMDAEVTVGPDGQTIEVSLAPTVTEYLGMINYGTPITTGKVTLTENRIEQPVFDVRRLTDVKVTLYSGQTATIGGLLGMETISVQDQTPVLGSLPVVGKFFRSKADHVKRKAIIFTIKAEVIDPSGMSLTGSNATAPAVTAK
jgi:general secretion pathway protein D